MRRYLLLILGLTIVSCMLADDQNNKLAIAMERINAFDQEVLLDSLDQDKLPKIVTGGLFLAANLSNFIITDAQGTSSTMNFGGDFGGLIDFSVTKHFAIQGRLVFTAEENYIKGIPQAQQVWSFGFDLPVYFMGRIGNLQQGYLSIGLGLFTHFTFLSNINAYTNNSVVVGEEFDNLREEISARHYNMYQLHNNHSGLAATIGYEFSNGIQLLFNYQISLTDIFTYYKNYSETNTTLYPQRLSLGIGYRWKNGVQHKNKPKLRKDINWN